MIKVFLLKNVKSLGHAGSIVEVKDGYAINYLIPNGLARYATDKDIKAFKEQEQKRKAAILQKKRILSNVKGFIERELAKKPIKIEVKASSGGRVYASITQDMLLKALLKTVPQLKVFTKKELYFEKPPKIEYVGKYAFDLVVEVKDESGKPIKQTLPIYVDVVSISKAKLKTHG